MSENDIVSDIIQRLAARLGADICPPDVMRLVEHEIRRDWSGGVVYVKHASKKARDMELRHLYRKGWALVRLAAHYHISERRVRQIIRVRD